MASPSRGPVACLGIKLSSRPRSCTQCLLQPTKTRTIRWFSSAPAAAAPTPTPTSTPTTPPLSDLLQPSSSSSTSTSTDITDDQPTAPPKKRTFPVHLPATHRLRAGIILTRPPLLTRTLTPFEESFYFYQKRLDERLVMPFVQNVYFKRSTPKGIDWKLKFEERQWNPARDIGSYRGRGAKSWQDELMVGDPLSNTEHIYDVLAKDAVMRVSEEAETIPKEERAKPELPLPRETAADKRGDVTRLDRRLDRTLYLVVKNKKGVWEFPADNLGPDEFLHTAAARVLEATAGVNMNTWLVGRVPVAHIVVPPKHKPDGSLDAPGSKTFFIKGRIMAGQADLRGNTTGYTEFKWLTPDEVKEAVPPAYFSSIRNMMPAR